MKYELSRRWRIVLLILIVLLVILACLPDDSSVDSQNPEVVTIQADVVFGPGPFIFTETQAGLADLSSYKTNLRVSFDGTRAGQTSQWSKTYVMLAANEPIIRQLTLEKTGDLADLDAVFIAEADGAAYERRAENACSASAIDLENSLIERLAPAGLLTGVVGAEEAGAETVNDVAANHYTFDERAFGQLGLAQSTGEMWVASEGGYIVRYLVTTKGDADYFGEGIEGTITWDYQVTDVNLPLTFGLPDDCPAGMVDAPLLTDASDVLSVPSLLTYHTSSSPAEAVAFYREQIPGLGWTLISEPAINETMALMEFMQGDQTLSVIITTDDTGTKVQIVLVKTQE